MSPAFRGARRTAPCIQWIVFEYRGTHICLSGCSLVGDGRQRGSCATSVPAIAWAVSEALLTDSREGSPWAMPRAFLGQLALSLVPTPDQNRSHPTSSVDGVGNSGYLCSLYLPARLARAVEQPNTSWSVMWVKQDSGCLPVTCFPAAYVPLPMVWETQGKAVSVSFHALQRALP